MKVKKKSIAILLTLLFAVTLVVFVSSSDIFSADTGPDVEISEAEMDEQLSDREVPTDVLAEMSYVQKWAIIENLDEGEIFEGYTDYKIEFYEDGLKRFIDPKSEVAVEVAVFKKDDIYNFYPSFKWDSKVRVNNDTFQFSLDDRYWTTVAGDVEMHLYRENPDQEVKYFFHYERATNSTFSSHGFTIPNQHGNKKECYYSGHAHFRARSLADETDSTIAISYIKNPKHAIEVGLFTFTYGDNDLPVKEGTSYLVWE